MLPHYQILRRIYKERKFQSLVLVKEDQYSKFWKVFLIPLPPSNLMTISATNRSGIFKIWFYIGISLELFHINFVKYIFIYFSDQWLSCKKILWPLISYALFIIERLNIFLICTVHAFPPLNLDAVQRFLALGIQKCYSENLLFFNSTHCLLQVSSRTSLTTSLGSNLSHECMNYL